MIPAQVFLHGRAQRTKAAAFKAVIMCQAVVCMKICSKCNTDNADNALHCAVCGAKLDAVDTKRSAEEYVDDYFKKEARKEGLERLISFLALGCFAAIYITLSVVLALRQSVSFSILLLIFILCVVGFVGAVFFPRAFFVLTHITQIDNIDDVALSDWYYISSKISGYLILLLGIIFLLWYGA